jgi:hypothetical protein
LPTAKGRKSDEFVTGWSFPRNRRMDQAHRQCRIDGEVSRPHSAPTVGKTSNILDLVGSWGGGVTSEM